jgi:LmbE family N-acetylglucosaminyl deacetylase
MVPAAGNPHYFPEQIAEGLAAHQVGVVLCSGTLEPDAWVDITATLDRKVQALACHASQVGDEAHWVPEVVRERAAAVGAAVGVAHAEAFRRLQLV